MIKLSIKTKYKTLVFLSLFVITFFYGQSDSAPEITAEGEQVFCVGNSINIVTDFTISDIDDTGIELFFIQISSGYQNGFDTLELVSPPSNISQFWDANRGKLILSAAVAGTEILFADLENAVKKVVFKTTATDVEVKKTFSLTIDDANYLPLTDHFYEFISNESITWTNAKIAAENRMYFGRNGYLATLTSQEEANFAGKQASGPGWIGGSDEETEGVWKWVTGPEAATSIANFWNGEVNGSTPNYANWNNNEPNNAGGNEDYAHITDPSIGKRGAWNDLPNGGGTGAYIPKGYIVEYGVPGDPQLNIVATTSIYIPQIETISNATICESSAATISANSEEGEIIWFDALTGGNELKRGNNFTTPDLNITTTYYVLTSVDGCLNTSRTPVVVNVITRPIITDTTNALICLGVATLSASASAGDVNWYTSETSTTIIFSGNSYQTPNLTSTTSYYVEASNVNCKSSLRTVVIAEVDASIPEFELEKDTYVLCNYIGTVTLKTIPFRNDYTFSWSKDNVAILENSSEINATESGNYSVKSISKAGCESLEQIIIVKNSEIAAVTKEDILIVDNSDNNSIDVTIANLGIGVYEFSLDDELGVYKDIGFFENISTGMHTLFVRDKGGCGTTAYLFSILEYPSFFTPNNDGVNDYWHIRGYDKDFYTVSDIYIYNRFGVLLYKLIPKSLGWNGTYGGKMVPSNSYWFKAVLTDINGFSVEKTGSFSLIRK
jgi:gliding motility-associated-like protein